MYNLNCLGGGLEDHHEVSSIEHMSRMKSRDVALQGLFDHMYQAERVDGQYHGTISDNNGDDGVTSIWSAPDFTWRY